MARDAYLQSCSCSAMSQETSCIQQSNIRSGGHLQQLLRHTMIGLKYKQVPLQLRNLERAV